MGNLREIYPKETSCLHVPNLRVTEIALNYSAISDMTS